MPNTYSKLSSVTLNTATANFSFTTIPATYSGVSLIDLKVIISARGTATTAGDVDDLYMQLNTIGSGYSTYWTRYSPAAGTTFGTTQTITSSALVGSVPNANATASSFGNTEITLVDYVSAAKYKIMNCEGYSPTNSTNHRHMRAVSTSTTLDAVTGLTFSLGAGNFAANTTADLYVISRG